MRLLLGFLILSMLLAGCSAIDDLDDVARMIANYSDDALRVIDKGDDAGRIVFRNQRWVTPMRTSLDDALRVAAKTSTTRVVTYDEVFNSIRQQNVRKIVASVEDANRVKISAKLEDALDVMVKDTACLYIVSGLTEQRLPTREEILETLVDSGASELFRYAGFEEGFLFSVGSELYNLESLNAETAIERLQAAAYKHRYCGG